MPGGAGLVIVNKFFLEPAAMTRVRATSQPKKFPSKADWKLVQHTLAKLVLERHQPSSIYDQTRS
jgi:hypothetical protein